MRAPVCFAAAVLSATAVSAAGLPQDTLALTKLDSDPSRRPLSAIAAQPKFDLPRSRERLPLLGPTRPMPGGVNTGFSIGPIHADAITRYSRSGKPHLAPHYRIDGVTILGGSLGGSVDGRGGMVTINWHTGP
ncbi:MAG TPA: hypothetical protein VLC74_06025 [Rhizomicrobium sp.]|nr:hypothetical protein [Rhizomicrobium sp.]